MVPWCRRTLKNLHLVTPVEIKPTDDTGPFPLYDQQGGALYDWRQGDMDRTPPLVRLIMDTRSDPRVLGILQNLWWAPGQKAQVCFVQYPYPIPTNRNWFEETKLQSPRDWVNTNGCVLVRGPCPLNQLMRQPGEWTVDLRWAGYPNDSIPSTYQKDVHNTKPIRESYRVLYNQNRAPFLVSRIGGLAQKIYWRENRKSKVTTVPYHGWLRYGLEYLYMLIVAQEGVRQPDEAPRGGRLVTVPNRSEKELMLDDIVGPDRLKFLRLLADDVP